MKLAIEQAGPGFTGWIRSCLSCLQVVPAESHHHEQAMRKRGEEREMRICHSQPQLVPPMELAAEGTSRQDRSSRAYLPSWAMESTRDRASKASFRTGVSLQRNSTVPLRIGAPSGFRRVESFFMPTQEPYSPLELSIHTPANRLSILPNFEDFQLQEPRVCPIVPPPRVLLHSQLERSRSYRPGVSYQFFRKPVRSGSRLSSLALEQSVERQIPISNPLIPHFSSRIQSSIARSHSAAQHVTSQPASNHYPQPALDNELYATPKETPPPSVPRTPTTPRTPPAPRTPAPLKTPTIPERQLPPPPSSTPLTNPRHPPQTPDHRRTPTYKSGRITQWLMTTSKTSSPHSTPSKPDRDTPHIRSRTRTLSGSTATSTLSSWTAGLRTTPSLSSGVTASTITRPSLQDSRMEKELEVAMSHPITTPMRPLPARFEDRPYSTIYEGQPPRHQQEDGYETQGYNYYAKYRESAIGLAF